MIREIKLSEWDQLQDLYAQLNPDDPVVSENQFKETLANIIDCEENIIFVKILDNEIAASCYLNYIPNLTRGLKPYALIENVITREDLRNKGYGKEIIKHSLNYAWELGCYKVMLLTSRKEESTLNFYRSAGFDDNIKTAFLAKPKFVNRKNQ